MRRALDTLMFLPGLLMIIVMVWLVEWRRDEDELREEGWM